MAVDSVDDDGDDGDDSDDGDDDARSLAERYRNLNLFKAKWLYRKQKNRIGLGPSLLFRDVV